MVVLTNTDSQQASAFAERVRLHIETANFKLPRPITISGGVCTFKKNESAKDLVHKADQALYEAKKTVVGTKLHLLMKFNIENRKNACLQGSSLDILNM